MLYDWNRIGVVVQATIIDDSRSYPDDVYLEVQASSRTGRRSSLTPIPGIYKALGGGLAAAVAIAGWLGGDLRALYEYRNDIARQFIDYLHHRDHFYHVERRWEDAPFWRRRRALPYKTPDKSAVVPGGDRIRPSLPIERPGL